MHKYIYDEEKEELQYLQQKTHFHNTLHSTLIQNVNANITQVPEHIKCELDACTYYFPLNKMLVVPKATKNFGYVAAHEISNNNTASIEACRKDCTENIECEAYNVKVTSNGYQCHLLKELGRRVRMNNVYSGLKDKQIPLVDNENEADKRTYSTSYQNELTDDFDGCYVENTGLGCYFTQQNCVNATLEHSYSAGTYDAGTELTIDCEEGYTLQGPKLNKDSTVSFECTMTKNVCGIRQEGREASNEKCQWTNSKCTSERAVEGKTLDSGAAMCVKNTDKVKCITYAQTNQYEEHSKTKQIECEAPTDDQIKKFKNHQVTQQSPGFLLEPITAGPTYWGKGLFGFHKISEFQSNQVPKKLIAITDSKLYYIEGINAEIKANDSSSTIPINAAMYRNAYYLSESSQFNINDLITVYNHATLMNENTTLPNAPFITISQNSIFSSQSGISVNNNSLSETSIGQDCGAPDAVCDAFTSIPSSYMTKKILCNRCEKDYGGTLLGCGSNSVNFANMVLNASSALYGSGIYMVRF